VTMELFREDGSPAWSTVLQGGGQALTPVRGYRVGAVPPGSYFVRVAAEGFVASLFDGVPCGEGCDVTAGVPVEIRATEVSPGIDFVLDPAPDP